MTNHANNQITAPKMRTIRQAARELSLPEYALRRLVKQQKIVYVSTGKKVLINLDKLVEYLNEGEVRT